METNPFANSFDTLPQILPIFPLTGAVLMPFGQLPLNIFEPRYIDMVNDAMAGDRLIGMIQPKESGADNPALYDIGCAGKITEFSETEDGRFLITLRGISRFKITEELNTEKRYREVTPDWSRYSDDLQLKKCLGVDRKRLCALLETYFDQKDMSCDFSKFDEAPDGKLMTCLLMVCPFEPSEKQALLEHPCCVQRASMFITMLEMAIKEGKPLDFSQKKKCH